MLGFCLNLPLTVLDAVVLVGRLLFSLAFLLVAHFWCIFFEIDTFGAFSICNGVGLYLI